MKTRWFFSALCISVLSGFSQNKPSIHSYTAITIHDELISMGKYLGKKIMLVNTASYCMYTPQFDKLEQLYKSYKQNNFEIIGFPCNDFGSQDPKSDSLINVFCTGNYSVTFQMMSKIEIAKGDTSPIYKWLQRANLNGVKNVSVDWNFNKFLIDECGHWIARYASPTSPLDTAITNWITRPACNFNPVGLSEEVQSTMVQFRSANPVNLTLDLTIKGAMEIDLYSIEGKLITKIQVPPSSESQEISHDVSGLSSGVYFLRISNGARVENKKFVVLN